MSATAAYDTKTTKFLGDGFPSKGKLIGMEDLSVDRDEKVCLESIFKLKAIAHARGEHKQRVQLNLTTDAVKIYDDLTKVQLVAHEVERISFVVMDPRDPRAFGYVYNTSDNRHQFWAIKTERSSAFTVMALKELFEAAFEKFTNTNKAKPPVEQTVLPPVLTQPPPVLVQQPTSETTSIPALLLPPPPVLPARPVTQPAQSPITPQFDNIWGDAPLTTFSQPPQQQQQPVPNIDIWGMDQSPAPVVQPQSRVEDSFADLFSFNAPPLPPTSTAQQSASTIGSNDLFSMITPPATTSTFNTNSFLPPTQQAPAAFQQPPVNLLNPVSLFPTTSPTVTNKFSEFDLLGDFS